MSKSRNRDRQHQDNQNKARLPDGWAALTVLAQHAASAAPSVPPAGFVERVLAGRTSSPLHCSQRHA